MYTSYAYNEASIKSKAYKFIFQVNELIYFRLFELLMELKGWGDIPP